MIKIYTKTVCPKCLVAKSFFENNDVEYEVVNIEQDTDSKLKLINLGFMSVPIVEHNEKFYQSMNEFQELLEQLQ